MPVMNSHYNTQLEVFSIHIGSGSIIKIAFALATI